MREEQSGVVDANRAALIAALAAVLMWSTVAAAFKLGLRYSTPGELVVLATAVSTALLGVVLVAQGRLVSALRGLREHPGRTLVAALLNPTTYYLVLFAAYDRLPAQVAQPLNYTWALTLAVLAAVVLKRGLTVRDCLCGLVCYGGVVVICQANGSGSAGRLDVVGVGLALGSTLLWAGYWLINAADPRPSDEALFGTFVLGLPMVLLCWGIGGGTRWPSREAVLAGGYIGCIEMGLAFLLWARAMRLAQNTARITTLIFLSPFLSLVFIYVVVGERIHPGTVVGLALIVTGLVVQQRRFPGGR